MASNIFSVLDPNRSSNGTPQTSSSTQNVSNPAASSSAAPGKKKKHRSGRKKRSRRKSFAVPPEDSERLEAPPIHRESFYTHGRNLSTTSIDSEALLDHREHTTPKPRRQSVMTPGGGHPSNSRLRLVQDTGSPHSDHFEPASERAPLLSSSMRVNTDPSRAFPTYGSNGSRPDLSRQPSRDSRHLAPQFGSGYHVNYPPSMPGTPPLGATDGRDLNLSLGDVMLRDEDEDRGLCSDTEDLTRPSLQSSFARRHTIALQAEEDVCFPQEGMSEMADDEQNTLADESTTRGVRRRRRGKWPDLAILEEWSRLEKEGRSEERRVKRITEPQLINGRLRPTNGHKGWYRSDEDAPYRFTYFNEEFPSTIHSQTISELVQPGGSFRELFIPDRLVLSDSESETSEDEEAPPQLLDPFDKLDNATKSSESRDITRQPSLVMGPISKQTSDIPSKENTGPPTRTSTPAPGSRNQSGDATPSGAKSPAPGIKSPLQVQVKPPKPIRYGERPVWWLDILCPTEAEMRVLQKAFAIHPLTSEDIMMQEQREKVELFRHYYVVSYRSFDQDTTSENHLDPINMYAVVFREGVLSFHFSQTPHPANVRRRIRQLKDYMIMNSDWISYAIIDDITDTYVPLIEQIAEEVDDIDECILSMFSDIDSNNKDKDKEDETRPEYLMRRIGDCRRKVMMLYRLMGTKADVVKAFAKRCNERLQSSPGNEIGLYLGDIQDHIVTMTGNLSHYEAILSRSHQNYISQINIKMSERSEQTADGLNKLTVLGTIVLPMNIITGMWGMNVWVPGQEYEGDLTWFFWITLGLIAFGLSCFWVAKRAGLV